MKKVMKIAAVVLTYFVAYGLLMTGGEYLLDVDLTISEAVVGGVSFAMALQIANDVSNWIHKDD